MTSPRQSGFTSSTDDIYSTTGYRDLVNEILEYVPELRWPMAGDVLNRMRKDSQIAAGLRAYTLPIRKANWVVDGEGCRPEVTAQIAEDLGLPVKGQDMPQTGARRRGVKYAEHLRMALLDLPFGHMPFEQTYDTTSGQARLVSIQERMPKTIDRIYVDGSGAIEHVTQHRVYTQPDAPQIAPPALVWYVNEREGVQWRGQSLLRECYPYWLIKDQMLRLAATSSKRFGMGMPIVKAPPGGSPAQIAEAGRIAQTWRASETSGGGLPDGFTAELIGMTGSVPDTLGLIKYLDSQISGILLTQFLNLGTTDTGSRSVGEVHASLQQEAAQAVANAHAEQSTDQIVVPLVDANWGDTEPAPRIVCGEVGPGYVLTPQDMALLVSSGALQPDESLDSAVRQQYKLPARTTPWRDPNIVADPMATFDVHPNP